MVIRVCKRRRARWHGLLGRTGRRTFDEPTSGIRCRTVFLHEFLKHLLFLFLGFCTECCTPSIWNPSASRCEGGLAFFPDVIKLINGSELERN